MDGGVVGGGSRVLRSLEMWMGREMVIREERKVGTRGIEGWKVGKMVMLSWTDAQRRRVERSYEGMNGRDKREGEERGEAEVDGELGGGGEGGAGKGVFKWMTAQRDEDQL